MNAVMTVNTDAFVRHINEVKRESGRDSEEMLKYVMILMLQAGRSATPLGRKNRPLETDGASESEMNEMAADDGSGMFENKERNFFTIYKQNRNSRRVYLPVVPHGARSAKRRELISVRKSLIARFKVIPFRGIARASWGWAMKMLSTSRAISEQAENLAGIATNNPIDVNKQIVGSNPYIEVINKLGYILKIAPGIEARMMASADARMQKWLEMRFQSGIDRAARRAA